VEDSVHDAFVQAMKLEIRLRFGMDPLSNSQLPKIINRRHFDRLMRLIEPSKVSIGGRSDLSQLLIEPTLLTGIKMSDPVMQEEIFGPILPVITIAGLEAGLQQVRSRSKPLALYLFSNDKTAQRRTLQTTSSGSVCFNDVVMQAGATALPFGGVGESGLGTYHGRAGFLTFSHQRSVLERPFWLDLPFRYPPYKGKLGLVKRLLG
ncbi:MAG: aldehyde dehydrogenase family protein, partial [Cyanobium sp. LacPavin_0920_WC12_MAG_62_9]|nr:aldehyde dehydrogenase family protein [Cyanobium sp. LacPavin_0920_WC12_MAG_62_9]